MIDTTRAICRWPEDQIGHMLGGAEFKRNLKTGDIRDMLRARRVRFVIAKLGEPLKPISPGDCYDVWKSDVKTHVCDTLDEGGDLGDFEGDYFYWAQEWTDGSRTPIVLLFKNH